MNYGDRTVQLLVGDDSTVSALAVGLSLLLGAFFWFFYPESGIQWSLTQMPVIVSMAILSVGFLATSVALDSSPPISTISTAISVSVGAYLFLFVQVTGGHYLVSLFGAVDWLLFLSFTLLAIGIALGQGGLLAVCWVNFPAHVAVAYFYYTHQSGTFVVFPTSRIIVIVLIASISATLFGVFGYSIARIAEKMHARFGIPSFPVEPFTR